MGFDKFFSQRRSKSLNLIEFFSRGELKFKEY